MAEQKNLEKRKKSGEPAQRAEAAQPVPAQELADRPAIAPAVDIHEGESEYLLLADVPGVTAGSVSIRYDRGELTLQATRKLDGESEVDYRRSFRVPDVIDASRIEAQLDHGVLVLKLPKAEEVRPRKIEIKSA